MQIHRLFDRADVPDGDQVAPNEIGLFQQGKVVKYVDHDGVVRTFGSFVDDGGDGLHWGENTSEPDEGLILNADGPTYINVNGTGSGTVFEVFVDDGEAWYVTEEPWNLGIQAGADLFLVGLSNVHVQSPFTDITSDGIALLAGEDGVEINSNGNIQELGNSLYVLANGIMPDDFRNIEDYQSVVFDLTEGFDFAIILHPDFSTSFKIYNGIVGEFVNDEVFAVEGSDNAIIRMGWNHGGADQTTDIKIDTSGGLIYADFDGGDAHWTDGGEWSVDFDTIYEASSTRAFFGVTPVTRRPAPSTLGDVITGLQELGLFH